MANLVEPNKWYFAVNCSKCGAFFVFDLAEIIAFCANATS